MLDLTCIVSVIYNLQRQFYSILPAWTLSCYVPHTVLHRNCLVDAAHSTCLFRPKTSASDLRQHDSKPDQSPRSTSLRFNRLVNRLHPDTSFGSNLLGLQAFTRVDTHTGEAQTWFPGRRCFCEELVFVPGPNAATKEDDGYLLGLVYDASKHKSFLSVSGCSQLSYQLCTGLSFCTRTCK